jgi:hypothetical protein
MSKLLCGIACLFLSAAAYADDQVIDKPLVAQSLAGFRSGGDGDSRRHASRAGATNS